MLETLLSLHALMPTWAAARHVAAAGMYAGSLTAVTDIGDSSFDKGRDVLVVQGDGSRPAAEYVGQGEMSAWFGVRRR
jgi:hypothetical protein